jgi:GT2 family glycosyltransferase
LISVIVPVKNGLPFLNEQLEALREQKGSQQWEVVVADNGSLDQSAEVVRALTSTDPRFRLVDASKTSGSSFARNLAAGLARGDILAFCDADDVVLPGWVESWVRALADADLAGGMTDFWSLSDGPPPASPIPRPPPVKSQFGFLEGAMSSNMAVRREAFEDVGGFDENLAVGEDIDLCWRLQLAGYRFATGAGVVARRERSGFRGLLSRSIAYGRCGPVLYQRYRDAGLRPDRRALRAWVWLVLNIPRLIRTDFRPTWARVAGWRLGRIIESIRRGVFFP